MSKPTIGDLMSVLGKILSAGDNVIGLVCGISYNQDDRPGQARIIVNRATQETHRTVVVDGNPPVQHEFEIYESVSIDQQWISLVWPPLTISPCYYYDVRIKEHNNEQT